MQDRYDGHATSLDGPVQHGFAIIPDDGTDLPEITRAIYVGVAGSLAVVLHSGAEVVLQGVVGGTLLPLRARRIKSSGTSADGIVGVL